MVELWPNLNSNWKKRTRSSPLVLPASSEVNLKVNHGDIRDTSQALPMLQATLEQREAVAVAPIFRGQKRSSAQECTLQPNRPPWLLHAVLQQQQYYLHRLLLDQERPIKVVTRRTSFRSSFSQLDGQDGSMDKRDCPTTPNEK